MICHMLSRGSLDLGLEEWDNPLKRILKIIEGVFPSLVGWGQEQS